MHIQRSDSLLDFVFSDNRVVGILIEAFGVNIASHLASRLSHDFY